MAFTLEIQALGKQSGFFGPYSEGRHLLTGRLCILPIRPARHATATQSLEHLSVPLRKAA